VRSRPVSLLVFAALALALVALAALALGPVGVPAPELWGLATGHASPVTREIVLSLRAPRVVLAILVGAALGMSGGVLQTTLRNPLAEPYLLGVSGGAAVGAVLATIAHAGPAALPLAAFGGASVAVVLAVLVARGATGGRPDGRTLLMAGVVIGALANAVIMIVLANAPADALRGALWWMMGSVSDAGWRDAVWLAGYVVIGSAVLVALAPDLDALALGDESAAALGVEVERATTVAFFASALLAAATVAAAGLVGFVGLIVPHLARSGGVTRTRTLLAACALLGAALTVAADLAARTLVAPAELPLGAVTALLGVPFFLWRLAHTR